MPIVGVANNMHSIVVAMYSHDPCQLRIIYSLVVVLGGMVGGADGELLDTDGLERVCVRGAELKLLEASADMPAAPLASQGFMGVAIVDMSACILAPFS